MTGIPDAEILQAFGLTGDLVPIVGGRGLCYCIENTVLRPAEDEIEAQWLAELTTRLPTSSHYRLAQPRQVLGKAGVFVHRGWTASSLLAGEVKMKPDFSKMLDISRSFHRDVAKLDLKRPAFIAQHSNRWREADFVTWEEKKLEDVDNVNHEMLAKFHPLLDRLEKIMRPLHSELGQQIIHGDMTGNILFDDSEPPGIIDPTPYWRPAEYANAIIVADALAWYGADRDLVYRYAVDDDKGKLLARALYWRCLTFLIDTDLLWIQVHLEKTQYQSAVDTVCSFLESRKE